MKKDVKKSSYYVWFLGAQECKNVRDVDSIIPVVSTLAEREKKVTPHKFTLQVSHRGLKIVHNVSALQQSPLPGGKSSKSDLVKHLIPDHAVTCVHRDEDLVAVILLLYNPVTKWPVHVHVYRCDSVETATLLAGQLQMLVNRPENKKKLNEIESRLRQTSRSAESSSNGRSYDRTSSSKRESPPSNSSSESGGCPPVPPGPPGHMTTLYDSLAAELKKKLGTGGKTAGGGAPILLPPRDYDTVHRHRGNLNGIDFRRCMSTNIVGVNIANKQDFGRRTAAMKMGSSGGSSGIGSDHAPSPEQYEPENAYADNNSSSDEDWNSSPLEEPLFAKPTANDHPLPRIRRQDSGVDSGSSPVQTSPEKDYYGRQDQHVVNPTNFKRQNSSSNNNNNVISPNLRDKYSDRNVALVQPRPRNSELQAKQSAPMTTSATAPTEYRRKPVDVRQRTPSPNGPGALVVKETPRERFKDAKEKFLLMEKERVDEQRSALKKCLERQRKDNVIRAAVRGSCGGDWPRSRDSDDENIAQDACSRNRYDYDDCFEDDRKSKNVRRSNRSRESLDNDYNNDGYPKPISSRRSRNSQPEHDEPRPAPRSYSAEDYLEHNFRPSAPEDRYKSPQRRTAAAVQPEAPRAAPRRHNHYNDAQPVTESSSSLSSSRANDYKRRSAAYAYEDDGCCAPSYGRQLLQQDASLQSEGRTASSVNDDDGLPPTAMTGREYKRRSAAYAYEDTHHHHQHQHQHLHQHHHQDGGGGGGYSRREMMADKRSADDSVSASPVSPRYRHSYAEAYHRHQHHPHQQQQSPAPPQDAPVYRHHNGSLQSNGRIGIAAIHPY